MRDEILIGFGTIFVSKVLLIRGNDVGVPLLLLLLLLLLFIAVFLELILDFSPFPTSPTVCGFFKIPFKTIELPPPYGIHPNSFSGVRDALFASKISVLPSVPGRLIRSFLDSSTSGKLNQLLGESLSIRGIVEMQRKDLEKEVEKWKR